MGEITSEQLNTLVDALNGLNTTLNKRSPSASSGGPDILGDQSQISSGMAQSIAGATSELDKFTSSLTFLDSIFGGLSEGASSFLDTIKSFVGSIPGVDAFFGALNKSATLILTNFNAVSNAIMGPVGAAFGFLNTTYDILIEKAAELAKAGYDYARALEEIRDKYGSFNETTSRTIKNTAQGLSSSLNAASGFSGAFRSKFSPGVQGGIEKLQAMDGIISDLGSSFDNLGEKQIADASAQLYVLKKGLNFNTEAMKQTGVLAQLSGKSVKSFSQDIMESVNKIGKQWGISTKVLGSDVGKALSNFKMLGKMTGNYVVEMTKAATFTRKLGIEINELTGLVDKFDEFESGADAAAQLAQGFGMVLDPLKMMNLQDPAARLQEVQRAFAATGRSIDSMTRQERGLLAQTSGLTEQQAALAFSAKGLSMSYDDIQKGADGAMKKQKSTEEIMNDLADNIKNVIVGFDQLKGFIEAFIGGFLRGFMGEKSIMSLLSKFANQLIKVATIGKETGRMFATILFGESSITGGTQLLNIFSKFGDMAVSIAGHIKTFTSMLKYGDVAKAFEGLITNVYKTVGKMFDGALGGINVASMIKKAASFMTSIIKGSLSFVIKQIPNITASLKSTGGTGVIGSIFGAIFESVKDLESAMKPLLTELIAQLPNMGLAIVESITNFLKNNPFSKMSFDSPQIKAIGNFFETLFDSIKNVANDWLAGNPLDFSNIGEGLLTKLDESIELGLDGKDVVLAGAGAAGGAAAAMLVNKYTNGFKLEMPKNLDDGMENVSKLGGGLLSAGSDLMSWAGDGISGLASGAKNIAAIGAGAAAIYSIPTIINRITEAIVSAFGALHKPRNWGEDSGIADKTSFIDLLKLSVDKFKNVNADILDSLGTFLLKLVGGGILAGAATFAAGVVGADSVDPAEMNVSLDNTMSLIHSAIDKFTNADMIETIKKSKLAFENLAIIGPMMNNIIDMMKNTIGIISALPTLPKAEVGDEKYAQALKNAIMIPLNILTGDGTSGSESLLNKIAGIDTTKFSKEKIVEIASIFDILEKASIATLKFTESGVDTTLASKAWVASNNLIQMIKTIPGILDQANTLPEVKQMAESEIKMKGALNVIDTYLNGMDNIMGLYNKLSGQTFDGNAPIFDAISTRPPNLEPALATLAKSFGAMSTTFKDVNLSNLKDNFDTLGGVVESYIVMINRVIAAAERSASLDAAQVLSIVTMANTVRDILADLPTIDIGTTIEDFNNGSNLAQAAVSVNGGAVNVTVNMNVTMDAMKLAGQLVVAGTVQATPDFEDYLQNDAPNREFRWTNNSNKTTEYWLNGKKWAGGQVN
jgi:hypothetical protein